MLLTPISNSEANFCIDISNAQDGVNTDVVTVLPYFKLCFNRLRFDLAGPTGILERTILVNMKSCE